MNRPGVFKTHSTSPRRGFTLIELTIVVAIMGILVAVAVPQYSRARLRSQCRLAARRIAADLNYARTYAQQTSKSYELKFKPDQDLYTMAGIPDVDHPGNDYEVCLADTPYPADIASVTFADDGKLNFDMYGRPDNTGAVVVNSGSFQLSVNIDETGIITISP